MVTWPTRSMPSVPGSALAAAARSAGGIDPNAAGHRAGVAQDPGEAAGVDPGDARHAVPAQHGVEAGLGPMVAVASCERTDDDASTERAARFEVGGVGAVVADVRRGEGDDLAGVTGVGDDLLIAAQDRVEHDLSRRDRPFGAEQLTFEDAAVGEHQCALANHVGILDSSHIHPF